MGSDGVHGPLLAGGGDANHKRTGGDGGLFPYARRNINLAAVVGERDRSSGKGAPIPWCGRAMV